MTNLATLNRTDELLNTPLQTRNNDALITLNSVEKSYLLSNGKPFQALQDVSFEIARGEYVAILGRSGSGKSTLLNLIAGLDRASGGDIQIDAKTLATMNENALAKWRGAHIGVVFQFFQLLPTLSVAENLILAMEYVGKIPSSKRRQRAGELLDEVGLTEQINKLPSTLSGGQQQRAAIARALANDPPILLADEPTGNLDSETAADINALFRQLINANKTILVVTHDANLAAGTKRIIKLKDGRIESDKFTLAETA
jgi:putative ABC transport system ATP-binding protein